MGRHEFEFRGRRPAKGLDYEEALRALRSFLEPFRNVLNPFLVGLVDAECEEKCVYSTSTVVWTVILGFLQHLHSRNAMDAERETGEYSKSVFELSGQPYDPGDTDLHTACSQTCCNRLSKAETAKLEGALVGLVRYLVRGKWFRDATLCGCLCVAVDGRQCHVGVVAWVDARETAYENGTGHDFRVVKYSCWDAGTGKYNGAFATSLEVCEAGRSLAAVGMAAENDAVGVGQGDFDGLARDRLCQKPAPRRRICQINISNGAGGSDEGADTPSIWNLHGDLL